jgi:SAM-dependent methyltransferase
MSGTTFDTSWEDVYAAGGKLNRYPWDVVVSFVYNNRPGHKTPADTHILEVGCGTAPNLWFAAREGFSIAGIDGSQSAIDCARERFAAEGLEGDLRVMDFTADYPWPDQYFDLAIDRCALSHCDYSGAGRAINEIHRVLSDNGRFLFNCFADDHGARTFGRAIDERLVTDITAPPFIGTGQVCFWTKDDIATTFAEPRWRIEDWTHLVHEDINRPALGMAQWQVVVRKI